MEEYSGNKEEEKGLQGLGPLLDFLGMRLHGQEREQHELIQRIGRGGTMNKDHWI